MSVKYRRIALCLFCISFQIVLSMFAPCAQDAFFGLRCLLIQYGVASKQKRKEKSLKIHYNVNKISGTTSPYSLHQTSSSKWGNIFLTCVFLRRLYNSSMGWKVFSMAHIESLARDTLLCWKG